MQKVSLINPTFFNIAVLKALSSEWPHYYLTMPNPILFNKLLISVKLSSINMQTMRLFQHFVPGIYLISKILQSEWPRAF